MSEFSRITLNPIRLCVSHGEAQQLSLGMHRGWVSALPSLHILKSKDAKVPQYNGILVTCNLHTFSCIC